MEPTAPAPWLTFVIMAALVSGFIGLMVLIAGIKRMARGESFWAPGERERPSVARSPVRSMRVRRGSEVRAGSAGANGVLRRQDGTFAGSERSGSGSGVRDNPLPMEPIAPDLPQTMDELIWAIEAVRLRTSGEERTKEAAIIRAFPHVTSKGGGAWQRASQLYDTINSAQKAGQASAQIAAPPQVAEAV